MRNALPPLASNDLLAASLFWIRAQECLYPLGSTILVLMLHANDYVRYPTVEAEDAKVRVGGLAVRLSHVGVYSRQRVHDGLSSISTHNRQQVAGRSLR